MCYFSSILKNKNKNDTTLNLFTKPFTHNSISFHMASGYYSGDNDIVY